MSLFQATAFCPMSFFLKKTSCIKDRAARSADVQPISFDATLLSRENLSKIGIDCENILQTVSLDRPLELKAEFVKALARKGHEVVSPRNRIVTELERDMLKRSLERGDGLGLDFTDVIALQKKTVDGLVRLIKEVVETQRLVSA